MKKLKSFAVAAGLLLVTAGVFAGKSKFAGTYALYSLNGTTYEPLTPLGNLIDLTATPTGIRQAQIVPSSSGSTNENVFGYTTSTGYVAIYTTF